MEHEATAPHTEHPPTTIRQYVMIGVLLTVLTLLELWLSYSGLPDGLMISLLLFLSAVKFVIVVALFMHLRFDNPLFWRLFVFGLLLAISLLLALIALFWNDESDIVGGFVEGEGGGAAHGEQVEGGAGGEGTGEGGTGGETAGTPAGEGGGATGDPAAGMVQGLPVAEFFQANCAVCHGANREGLIGPALTPERLTEPDAFYHETIANGRPGTAMPSWSAQGLTDEDITALVQFIKNVEP